MLSIDIIRVFLSFIIAGAWVTAATIIAEKLGSEKGGLIANMPSNIVISMVFISLIHGENYAAESAMVVPIGMAINSFFILSFIYFIKRNIVQTVAFSLFIWGAFAVLANLIALKDIFFILIIYFIITLFCYLLANKKIKTLNSMAKNIKYSFKELFFRFALSGGAVGTTVALSLFIEPSLVGILAAFPAVLLSTLVILYLRQSKDFAAQSGKILILSSSNIVVYSILVYLIFPEFGFILGSIISFLSSIIWIFIISVLIRRIKHYS